MCVCVRVCVQTLYADGHWDVHAGIVIFQGLITPILVSVRRWGCRSDATLHGRCPCAQTQRKLPTVRLFVCLRWITILHFIPFFNLGSLMFFFYPFEFLLFYALIMLTTVQCKHNLCDVIVRYNLQVILLPGPSTQQPSVAPSMTSITIRRGTSGCICF